MTEQQRWVRQFHDRFLADARDRPGLPTDELLAVRVRLIDEEAAEFAAAARVRDLPAAVDALADLMYVVLGTAVVLGVDLDPIFAEVHRSNMTKERPTGKRRKPAKGAAYSPPDIGALLAKQGWSERNGDPLPSG